MRKNRLLLSTVFSVLLYTSLVLPVESAASSWVQNYGGVNNDEAYSLVQTSDGGYALLGYTTSFGAGGGVWLVKTDANGNMQWNRVYDGNGTESVESLIQTGDGGYALAGYTNSFGAGDYDFWLVKTDENGVSPVVLSPTPSLGLIVGLVIAIVIIVFGLALLIYIIKRKRKQKTA